MRKTKNTPTTAVPLTDAQNEEYEQQTESEQQTAGHMGPTRRWGEGLTWLGTYLRRRRRRGCGR